MSCPNPVGVYFSHEKEDNFSPIPCKRWDCPHCGKIKKLKVLDRVSLGFSPDISGELSFDVKSLQKGGYRVRLMTLTQQPGSPVDLLKAWARFRALLAKRKIKIQKFFWVKEKQPSTGEMHLHVMINRYLHWSVILECWRLATRGYGQHIDIRSKVKKSVVSQNVHFAQKPDDFGQTDIEIKSPGGYMMKYLTKSLKGDYHRHERRYGYSRYPGFRPIKYVPKEKYVVYLGSAIQFVRWWAAWHDPQVSRWDRPIAMDRDTLVADAIGWVPEDLSYKFT